MMFSIVLLIELYWIFDGLGLVLRFDIMVGGCLCEVVVVVLECCVFVEGFFVDGCIWIYIELFVDVE